MMISVLVSAYSPFPSTLSFSLPPSSPISTLASLLSSYCPPSQQSLSSHSSLVLDPCAPIFSLTRNDPSSPVFLRLAIKLPGGKGGFASQLRAQGGRMSSNKATNNDSCRDLNGRRLSTIKEATKLAAYIQAAPDRAALQKKEAQAKLDKLNAEIARLDQGSKVASTSGAAGAGVGGQKRRLDDSKFVEESRELNEGVRDAVKLAMMKKRKKNKPEAAVETSTSDTTVKPHAFGSGSDKEQIAPKKGVDAEEEQGAEGEKQGENVSAEVEA